MWPLQSDQRRLGQWGWGVGGGSRAADQCGHPPTISTPHEAGCPATKLTSSLAGALVGDNRHEAGGGTFQKEAIASSLSSSQLQVWGSLPGPQMDQLTFRGPGIQSPVHPRRTHSLGRGLPACARWGPKGSLWRLRSAGVSGVWDQSKYCPKVALRCMVCPCVVRAFVCACFLWAVQR